MNAYLVDFHHESTFYRERFVAATADKARDYAVLEFGNDIEVSAVRFVESDDDDRE